MTSDIRRYRTIVMDPPWPIEPMVLKKYALSVPYKTMTLEEIGDLPINDISADNCILFLWTTHTFLPECFPLLKKWGFKYYVTLTWNKVSGLTHQGIFRVTEFVLVAYKGKLTLTIQQTGRAIPALFKEPKGRHSEKPLIFDEIVRRATFEPRYDMFARKNKYGFDSHGNDKELEVPLTTLHSFSTLQKESPRE